MYPLFYNHLDLTKQYWQRLISSGDIIIDATCGNGKDALFLAERLFKESNIASRLYGLDIDALALERTQKRFREHLDPTALKQVILLHQSHSTFPADIQPQTVKLIVYNLGYLPGGASKQQTTMTDSTLKSLAHALELIMPGGAISITCYPGHPEGKKEEEAIFHWIRDLSSSCWNCCIHQWINRPLSPSLCLIQKKSS